MRTVIALIFAATLAACASKPSVQTSTRCPPLKSYSPEVQQAVAEEWDTLSWRVRTLLNDYYYLREQCRAL